MSADGLVVFGATGDLARRKLFPAVAVAVSGWDDARLREYAAEAVRAAVRPADGQVLDRLAGGLAMVSGDYRDPATFAALARRLSAAGVARPVHYLAIPPSLFPVVVEGLARAGLGHDARVVVKSRSAGTWPRPASSTGCCTRCSLSDPSSASTTTWARRQWRTCWCSGSPTRSWEPIWNRRYVSSVQVTMAEPFGVEGRAASTTVWAQSAT